MHAARRPTSLLILAGLLGACSTSATSSGGVFTPPTGSQVTELAGTLQGEVESDLGSLNATTAITPAFLRAATVPGGISAALAGAGACVAPSSTTDTDGDGIYNDATFTFTVPPCTFTNRRGGTVSLTGSLRIQDPTTTADFAYTSTLTNLALAYTGASAATSYTVTRTGTRAVSVTAGGLSLAPNLTIQRTFAGDSTATITKQWTAAFTPSTGASLAVGQPLPSGSISLNGSFVWRQATSTFTLTVATVTPLQYDATCNQPQPFTAGQIRAAGTFNGYNGFIQLTWVECGIEPTAVFIAT